jgi:hypothetical protein
MRGSLDRATELAMLEQVAFGAMPKGGMRASERRSLVRALVAAIWPDEASRRDAERWYGGMRALPAEREDATLRLIEQRAGARDDDTATWSIHDGDRHDVAELGTTAALSIGLAALRDCKAGGKSGAELDACVARAADLVAQAKSR